MLAAQLYQQTHQKIVLNCAYASVYFWEIGDLYACSGIIDVGGDHDGNATIAGFHSVGKTNQDILGVKLLNTDAEFIPGNIGNVFPNVEAFMNEAGGLTRISKEDVAQFSNLKQLHLYGHKITVLNSDLFASNPHLKHISFGGNPLQHIGSNTFDDLGSLQSIYLANANCIDASAINDRAGVKKILFKLKVSCPPSFEMIEAQILQGPAFKRKVEEQVLDKLTPLMWKLIDTEKKLSDYKGNCIQ